MKNKKLAIFFDCENISPKYITDLLNELASQGEATIKRAYGDWRDDKLKNWDELIREHAIVPVLTNYYKKPNDNTRNSEKTDEQKANAPKNVSDFAMVIDVMNTINQNRADSVVLVSSDSDFTSLANEIKAQGFEIIGCGEKKTPPTFQNACSSFIRLPVGSSNSKKDTKEKQTNTNSSDVEYSKEDIKVINLLKDAINRNKQDDGFALIAQVGVFLKNKQSTQIASNFGYDTWGDAFRKFSDVFELTHRDENKHQLAVRIKR